MHFSSKHLVILSALWAVAPSSGKAQETQRITKSLRSTKSLKKSKSGKSEKSGKRGTRLDEKNAKKCKKVPSTGCSICGEGLCVGNPDAVFDFPGQQKVPCGELERAGFAGEIDLFYCSFIPILGKAIGACGCGTSSTDPDEI
jgi:hypothetical protein